VSLTSFDLLSGAHRPTPGDSSVREQVLRFQVIAARFLASFDFLFLFSNSGGRLSLGAVCSWPTSRSFGDPRLQKIVLVRQRRGGNSRGYDRLRRRAQRVSHSQTPALVSSTPQQVACLLMQGACQLVTACSSEVAHSKRQAPGVRSRLHAIVPEASGARLYCQTLAVNRRTAELLALHSQPGYFLA